jgi:hypothetical protein
VPRKITPRRWRLAVGSASPPAGTSVEARVRFAAELVAAKVTARRSPMIPTSPRAEETRRQPQSVFHAGVRAGVGVATAGDERFFVFVLASAAGALLPSLGADLAACREAFLAAANAPARARPGAAAPMPPSTAPPRARRGNARGAVAGKPPSTVADLASRLNQAHRQPGDHGGQGERWRQRRP